MACPDMHRQAALGAMKEVRWESCLDGVNRPSRMCSYGLRQERYSPETASYTATDPKYSM